METLIDNDESNNYNLECGIDSMINSIYNLDVWLSTYDHKNAHSSIAILFSTEQAKKSDQLEYCDGGEYLKHTVKWPSMMVSAEEMRKKCFLETKTVLPCSHIIQ